MRIAWLKTPSKNSSAVSPSWSTRVDVGLHHRRAAGRVDALDERRRALLLARREACGVARAGADRRLDDVLARGRGEGLARAEERRVDRARQLAEVALVGVPLDDLGRVDEPRDRADPVEERADRGPGSPRSSGARRGRTRPSRRPGRPTPRTRPRAAPPRAARRRRRRRGTRRRSRARCAVTGTAPPTGTSGAARSAAHAGRWAWQVRRPWRSRLTCSSSSAPGGVIRSISSCSFSNGALAGRSPSRVPTRETCVSTGTSRRP